MRTIRSGRSAWIAGSALVLASVLGGPSASGGPLSCADPCEITAFQAGYILPLTEIATGGQVLWSTTESSHPTSNSPFASDRCFVVPVGSSVVPVPVQFDVAGGTVQATTAPGTPKQSGPVPCGNAIALPAGGFVLPFGCLLHPWMHGALLVSP